MLTTIDEWLINEPASPGFFIVVLGLILGTWIIPDLWSHVRKHLLGRVRREFEADFDLPINQDARDDFSTLLDRAYLKYKGQSTQRLSDLIDNIGFPSDFPPTAGSISNYAYNIDWPSDQSEYFWNFMVCLMSDMHSGNSSGLLSAQDAEIFRRARRVAAKFWNRWALKLRAGEVRFKDMQKKVFENQRALTALAVAELAHAHCLSLGLGAGKTGLFELAVRPAVIEPKPLIGRMLERIKGDGAR